MTKLKTMPPAILVTSKGDETGEGGEDGVETKGEGTMESAAEGEDDGSTAEGDQQPIPPAMAGTM